uniref:Osteoclast-stimulating factor 1 n=1 Tax=Esox lucius TaxID=8010 RepID=A0A6Q2YE85_ESOLU
MELWRQCAVWLIECRVLPESHRVTWASAQVCELAQALRDGVLLCQLLNNLLPHAINLREINLRPQMSQFLCLKNIRTFLGVCQDKFHLKKTELFEAFDLFDVRDFGKVPPAFLRVCVYTVYEMSVCCETVDEDDDLYDCVEDEENEGDEIYEDLMRADEPQETCTVVRLLLVYCGVDIVLNTHFSPYCPAPPLHAAIFHLNETICVNNHDFPLARVMQELAETHRSLLGDIQTSILTFGAENLFQVFINYKERLLPYGRYCSQVEAATKHLDRISTMKEDVRMKLEECSNRANNGRFSLRDLLMVPMQRVLKYHLLLQELVKHTTSATEKENLRTALDAMRDLAQCVNEVKRDNEIIKQITTFQLSIENMTQSLALYGRPKIDGELKICSTEKKSKQDRYSFLFDKAMFVCKKKSGETMELKETIDLQNYQLRDETTSEKDNKKWSHSFLLIDSYGKAGYDLFFKTRDLKKKWLEQFEMALSNMCPENCTANNHDFQMHCFEDTTCCKACCMLLRGIFFQGYRCTRCKMAAHKECLGRVPACGRNSGMTRMSPQVSALPPRCLCFPKMEVCEEYYGLPPPPVAFGQPLHLSMGDVIELTKAEADLQWLGNLSDLGSRFAGNMDRSAAKNLLISRSDGTFLVRQKDGGEFEMVQHYQQNSLKEYFKDVDTTLQTPFKQPEQSNATPNAPSPGGSMRSFSTARARYDFSARDRTELSLREGDTVKVLSKKAHNGWWKGEVYGRVGLFPANYVEEDYSDYC